MKTVIAVALLSLSFAAQGKNYPVQDLKSWTALKNMCENFKDFGAQIPPEDIQVKCQTNRKFTSVVGSKDMNFPGSGSLVMSVTSTKADVTTTSTVLAVDPTVIACPTVAQFKQVASGTFPTTCDELKTYSGSFADFCLEKLSGGNYEGAAEQIPGTERSLCSEVKSCEEESLH
jgi:hypothetical protein